MGKTLSIGGQGGGHRKNQLNRPLLAGGQRGHLEVRGQDVVSCLQLFSWWEQNDINIPWEQAWYTTSHSNEENWCLLPHCQVVSFQATLCLCRCWSPRDWKKSKSGIQETRLLTLTCVLSSIVCPWADHWPSSSSLLRCKAWRGWASWGSDPDLTFSEP